MPSKKVLLTSEMQKMTELEEEERYGSSPERKFCCNWCSDTKFHMYVNMTKMVFHCFKCDARGRVVDDLSKNLTSTISHSKVEEVLSSRSSSRSSREIILENKTVVRTIPRNKDLTAGAIDYLLDRGVDVKRAVDDLELLSTYDGTGIIFSIGLEQNTDECDYYVIRNLYEGPGKPKYQNAPWDKDGNIYFIWKDKGVSSKVLVICEGCFDAISISREFNACALLGKTATVKQIDSILKLEYDTIVIMLDDDAPVNSLKLRADLMTRRYALNKKLNVVQATLGTGSDPGDATPEQIRRAVNDALLLLSSRSS